MNNRKVINFADAELLTELVTIVGGFVGDFVGEFVGGTSDIEADCVIVTVTPGNLASRFFLIGPAIELEVDTA